eukprot:TRINITY_DN3443_c0_g1_i1.p1 TRINITY_DN3443_c0_g1~~TRINITY_DN3443_c0_g1_i1.p1  ORF type:complete len:252 (-),score=36.31 TRINITY_DN3443_c0_g1_i1:743-1498(-)
MVELSQLNVLNFTDEDLSTLFGNIEQIYQTNILFLQGLYERCTNWSNDQCFGPVINQFVPFLKSYGSYSQNFDAASEIYNRYEERSDVFSNFIEEKKLLPECRGLDFRSYLIMPIQRLPRYRMLLEDMIKHTPEDHPDYFELQNGLEQLMIVADSVNQAIVEAEEKHKLYQIAKKLITDSSFTVMKPSRSYIMDGDLHKICRKSRKKRKFFLFNDVFLYSYSQTSGKYVLIVHNTRSICVKITYLPVVDSK